VLAKRFPDLAEMQPELLAHHYTETSLAEPAVEYWQRAGERSNTRFAYAEAISHVTTALALLETLPGTVERTQR
jgi:predicted ATPase